MMINPWCLGDVNSNATCQEEVQTNKDSQNKRKNKKRIMASNYHGYPIIITFTRDADLECQGGSLAFFSSGSWVDHGCWMESEPADGLHHRRGSLHHPTRNLNFPRPLLCMEWMHAVKHSGQKLHHQLKKVPIALKVLCCHYWWSDHLNQTTPSLWFTQKAEEDKSYGSRWT